MSWRISSTARSRELRSLLNLIFCAFVRTAICMPPILLAYRSVDRGQQKRTPFQKRLSSSKSSLGRWNRGRSRRSSPEEILYCLLWVFVFVTIWTFCRAPRWWHKGRFYCLNRRFSPTSCHACPLFHSTMQLRSGRRIILDSENKG